jgi:hypothetical protein
MKKKPKVMSGGDAHKYLKISRQRFEYLVRDYDIPYQETSAGKIFFLEDLDDFEKKRITKMKHKRKDK